MIGKLDRKQQKEQKGFGVSYIEDNRDLANSLAQRKIDVTTKLLEADWRLLEVACHAFEVPTLQREELLSAAIFNVAASIVRAGGENVEYLVHLRDFALCQMIDREHGWPTGKPAPDEVQFD